MRFEDVFALFSCGFVTLGCLLSVVRVKSKWIFPITVSVLMLLPIGGINWLLLLRGIVGDFSLASLWLAVLGMVKFYQPSHIWLKQQSRLVMWVLLAGLLLYPGALGWGAVDPYTWGYRNPFMLLALGIVLFSSILKNQWLVYLWLVSAFIFFNLELFESTNLWDYLIDPVAVLWSLVIFGRRLIWRVKMKN